MQTSDIIRCSIDYIEHNLKTEITADELAIKAGYSVYHYCRLFSSKMDSSVAHYITMRRLDYALGEIAGGRKAIDVSLEYGFDTFAGFYKVFRRIYGCSPKKYLSIYNRHTPRIPEVTKMQQYTEKDLRKILENWGIPKDLPIEDVPIMDGKRVSGSTWRVGGDMTLRVASTPDERQKLLKNLKIQKALAKQGFVSSLLMQTMEGQDYLDESELIILTGGVKGAPLPKSDRFGVDRALFGEKYGRSIARLHKALNSVENDVIPDDANLLELITQWALPIVRQQNEQWCMELGEEFFTDYADAIGNLYPKLPRQLIHRDPNPSHILFDNGEVTGITNFDLNEKNVRLWDICYCATGLMSETDESNYEKCLDLLGGTLRGYDSELKLLPEEKQAVYYVICSIEFICLAFFEGHDELRPLAAPNRKMLQFIVKNRQKIEQMVP